MCCHDNGVEGSRHEGLTDPSLSLLEGVWPGCFQQGCWLGEQVATTGVIPHLQGTWAQEKRQYQMIAQLLWFSILWGTYGTYGILWCTKVWERWLFIIFSKMALKFSKLALTRCWWQILLMANTHSVCMYAKALEHSSNLYTYCSIIISPLGGYNGFTFAVSAASVSAASAFAASAGRFSR